MTFHNDLPSVGFEASSLSQSHVPSIWNNKLLPKKVTSFKDDQRERNDSLKSAHRRREFSMIRKGKRRSILHCNFHWQRTFRSQDCHCLLIFLSSLKRIGFESGLGTSTSNGSMRVQRSKKIRGYGIASPNNSSRNFMFSQESIGAVEWQSLRI